MNETPILEMMALDRNRGFRLLVEEFTEKIYNISYSILRNRDDAEDATQEIFLKLHEKLDTFRGQSKLSTWIYRISVNHCLNKNRSRENRHVSFHDIEGIETVLPGRALGDEDLKIMISDALDKMPLLFRTILVLKEIEGLSYEEIGAILRCRKGTVSSRLHKARRMLRSHLSSAMVLEDIP